MLFRNFIIYISEGIYIHDVDEDSHGTTLLNSLLLVDTRH